MKTYESVKELKLNDVLNLGKGVYGGVSARKTKKGVIVYFTNRYPADAAKVYVRDDEIKEAFSNLNSIGLQNLIYEYRKI